MKTINVNGISFRGQFAENYEFLMKGEQIIDISCFKNGAWEPTTKISRFMDLLDKAKVEYIRRGESLRTTELYVIKQEWELK